MEFVSNPEPSPFEPATEPVTQPASEPIIDPAVRRAIESPVGPAAVSSADAGHRSRPGAVRRMVATLVLAAGLLAVGGVSAVWAASPDPSAATTPSTTPSTTDGTSHPKGNCPNMGASSSGTNGSTSSPSTSG